MSQAKWPSPSVIMQFESDSIALSLGLGYPDMEEWENSPDASKVNNFNLFAPTSNTYKLGNQVIYDTYLLNVNPYKFHWETRMSAYYKKIIHCCFQRGWEPPSDLYKYLQVYPRYHNDKLIILTWCIDEVIYKNIIKLLTIKKHDVFNPNICIINQDTTLKIDKLPLLYNSKSIEAGTYEVHEPILTTIPGDDIERSRNIYNYLQTNKKKIIATGHLTNEPNQPLFIIKKTAEISCITNSMLFTAPLEIITTNNSMNEQKTLNPTKTTTFTKKRKKKKRKRIKKVKKCNWCQINNKQLKKSQTNKSFPTKLKICKCKATYYCSRGHQKKHWKKKHRFNCIANKKK